MHMDERATAFLANSKSVSEESAYEVIEPMGAVPLHPMGALIEQVKLGVGNELKEQEAALH